MSVSVLLIGAGGALGQPLLQELIRQRDSFKTVAILAATSERAEKFEWAKQEGVKVVLGSFLEPKSYEGRHCRQSHPTSADLLPSGFTHVISAVGNALMRTQAEMLLSKVELHIFIHQNGIPISPRKRYPACGTSATSNLPEHTWWRKQRNIPISNTPSLSPGSSQSGRSWNFMGLIMKSWRQ
jgi:hypothetical protein